MSSNDLWQLLGQITVALIGATAVVLAAWIAAKRGRRKRS